MQTYPMPPEQLAALYKALDEQKARHEADPAEARRFLMKLGCWNEDGTLKEEWGGEPTTS